MLRWLVAGAVLTGFGVGTAYVASRLYDAPGPLQHADDVVVPHGNSAVVGRALRDAGVLDDVRVFRVAAALTAWWGPLRSAEFTFPAHASLAETLVVLRNERPVQHLLTIPEGLTAARISSLIARSRVLTGPIDLPPEGAFLPQTYAFQHGTSARSLLQRAEQAMQADLDEAWRSRSADLRLLSPRDLLILASLVERETHLASERPLVARVFLNRLSRGMRLQSDPSVVYGETGGETDIAGGLTRDALEHPTPYNTYVVPGLPAGPICSPGHAAIEAVAHPARSPALYFVADGSGGHAFSDSLDEHVRNVKRSRRLVR